MSSQQTTVANISAQKKASDALGRVRHIEEVLFGKELPEPTPGFLAAVNKAFNDFNSRFNEFAEVMDVVVAKLGEDAVRQELADRRKAANDARVAKQQEALDAALASGDMSPVDVITENSIIVGNEVGAEGTPGSGKMIVHFKQLVPEVCETLLGKGKGATAKASNGATIEVLGVFEPKPVEDTTNAVKPV